MRARSLIVFSMLFGLFVISSCGDKGTSPSGEDFSLALTIVDRSGTPMEGLNISRLDKLTPATPGGAPGREVPSSSTGPKAGATEETFITAMPGEDPPYEFHLYTARPNPSSVNVELRFDVPAACDVEAKIFDYDSNLVYSFKPFALEGSGFLLTFYFLVTPGDERIPNGMYRAAYSAFGPGTDDLLFEDSVWFAAWTLIDPFAVSIGETGPDGIYSTENKAYFSCLQGHQPMMGTDDDGNPIDLFRFSGHVTIVSTTQLPPGEEGHIYWMSRDIFISDSSNDFEWTFVPEDSVYIVPDA